MRASSNRRAPAHPGALRASDAERDQAINELRDRFSEGRLSQDTFLYRMDAALKAKNQSELVDLFVDLPAGQPGRQSAGWSAPNRLARLWRSASDWLGAGRARPSFQLPTPQNVTSMAFAGPAGAGYPGPSYTMVAAAEPEPLCLPRQADRKLTIGRAPSCDFTVADLSVSRWHARLHKEDDRWLLSDLSSTNGTRLNGWRVTSAVPVRLGDKVSFGSAAYVIIDQPLGSTA